LFYKPLDIKKLKEKLYKLQNINKKMVDFVALLPAIFTIVIGLVILIWPKILNIAIALYLLIIGILKLLVALEIFTLKIPLLLALSLL
jgi:phage-related minor tail protein